MIMEQQDIEIYVKNTPITEILEWLQTHFDVSETNCEDTINTPKLLVLRYLDQNIELMITPFAAGKAYTSLWFKSRHTPWASDIECGKSFLHTFDTEVRCSAEGWQESEEEVSEKWWKLTRSSQEQISWG